MSDHANQSAASSFGATRTQPSLEPANGMAVAALVLGLVGVVVGVTAPIAVWLGFLAKRKVDEGLTTQGRGMAIAGLVLGVFGMLLFGAYLVIAATGS